MITVLTPTYNRSYILKNAYESLCSQTNNDFEWLIVDDGSTDETSLLVESWIKQTHDFKIRYFKQLNGGKHRAVNFGVSKSKGEYILILDSDDYLTSDAIAFVSSHLKEVAGNDFAGISGLKGWSNSPGIIGDQDNDDSFVDATNIERTRKGLAGDKAEVYKRDILLKYPFPEFEGENFLRESASWDRIAMDGYKIRWFNHVICKCNYLDDGLTKKNNIEMYVNNYQGFIYCTRLSLKTASFPYNLIKIGQFEEVAKASGNSNIEICKTLNIWYVKLITGVILFKARGIIKKILNK
ncbi:glycosyltransferase family 2 protein [Bacillus cereus]|nr:glycosyltransferase family 2 protein [Bacillus cereus]